MNRGPTRIFLLSGLTCLVHGAAEAQAPKKSEPVAMIRRIDGTVYLRQGTKGPVVKLNARRDANRILYFVEWIQVAPGSALVVTDKRLDQRPDETLRTPVHGVAHWVTLPHLSTPAQLAFLKVLTDVSELGGRKRAGGSLFFVPAPNSVVRPEHLI